MKKSKYDTLDNQTLLMMAFLSDKINHFGC